MKTVNQIAPPQRSATDLHYETELKDTLDPILGELLDTAESAGWNRRKAAYTIMFLAARNLSEIQSNTAKKIDGLRSWRAKGAAH